VRQQHLGDGRVVEHVRQAVGAQQVDIARGDIVLVCLQQHRVLDADGARVLVSSSSNEAEVRSELAGTPGKGGNANAATVVGKRIAEKALAAGIQSVAFDRAGYRFHGRVKALAEAAREAGLKF